MSKLCKQREHEWERITEPLWPFRCKCRICGAIGKLYGRGKKDKILPIPEKQQVM